MNERYLFRGKHADTGEWIIGYYAFIEMDGDHIINVYDRIPPERYVKPETIGQCTGQRGKDGRLIFEGDIVDTDRGAGIVKWHDKGLTGWLIEFSDHRLLMESKREYEVIGNVHDNPELLRAEGSEEEE